MKIYNKKTVVVLTLSLLMINGCLPRHGVKRVSSQRVVMLPSIPIETKNLQQPQKSWKRFKPLITKSVNKSKTDCVDCYATPIEYPKSSSVSKRSFSGVAKKPFKISYNHSSAPIDYSKPPSNMSSIKHYGRYSYSEKVPDSDNVAITQSYKNENFNSYILPTVSSINNSYNAYGTFSNNSDISIQVGAFREYDGAKRYARRYRVLSSKYRTTIKTGTKNSQPIYRVQIEGFKSDREAKRFMNNYAIQGAFLVRR